MPTEARSSSSELERLYPLMFDILKLQRNYHISACFRNRTEKEKNELRCYATFKPNERVWLSLTSINAKGVEFLLTDAF